MTEQNDKGKQGKGAEKKSAKSTSKKKQAKKRIPYLSCPEGLDLKTWQIQLRRQAARDEKLSIKCVDEERFPGEYSVLNLQSASIVINMDLPWNPAVLEQRIARIYRIGQQKNIQVINLVSADTFEEDMLGKLRFKSSMFEGVLDGGEDTIFASESRFQKMMEELSETMNVQEDTHAEGATINVNEEEPAASESEHDTVISELEMSERKRQPVHPNQLVEQGISFFAGLAETLKSPEATKQLVDNIVEKNPDTGETHIRIPVPDKNTVVQLFDLVGKLFASK